MCVQPSVCAFSICCKNSSNVLKLMYVIQAYYRMFHIESGLHKINSLCTEPHRRFKMHYFKRQTFLKGHFNVFIRTIYNEIKMSIQMYKRISAT